MEVVGLVIASLLVGLLVGILSGLLGVGGGTLFVPLFRLAYGLPAIACTATSMLAILFTSVSGAVSHLRNRTCIPWLGLAAGLGGALTSPVGVYLATISPDWLIMVAAAAIIAYSAITMVRKGLALQRLPKGLMKQRFHEFWESCKAKGLTSVQPAASASVPAATAAPQPSEALTQADFPVQPRLVVKGALIGLVAGVMSGYVGVGGGFIMVPMMLQILKAPMRLVSGTSLIAILVLAIPSVVYQAILGNIAWIAGIAIALGSMPGAVVGAKVLPWMPERALRLLFGGFLLVVAALMVVNQLGVWG